MTNTRARYGLSKSRITAFEQCPKKLWLSVHRPAEANWDERSFALFAGGNTVGDVACALYPGGVMVEAEPDLLAALATTQQLINDGHPGPIFEATFQHEGVLVRVDVLERLDEADGGSWYVAEVKSSTGVKDYHHGDLATQIWVMTSAGMPLAEVALRHVDRSFVLTRQGDYTGLFSDVPMMEKLAGLVAGRGEIIDAAKASLAGPEPEIVMGAQCHSPFTCEFIDYCSRGTPEKPEWPISCLPGRGRAKWVEAGYESLLDLPESELSPQFAKIVTATRDDKPFHDAAGARQDMSKWGWPRAWLDFETIAPAVPIWLGTRPYQQVPFQFSLHLEQEDGSITHHEFLSVDGMDPRPSCAARLAAMIPAEATVIAYNASFERSVLRALAEISPNHCEALLAMAENTVDLLPIARKRWYHRDQRGSWSIKAVLPTIAPGLDYTALEVKDGGNAQVAWAEAVDPNCNPLRREALTDALRAYCERDTWAMVVVARGLVGTQNIDFSGWSDTQL